MKFPFAVNALERSIEQWEFSISDLESSPVLRGNEGRDQYRTLLINGNREAIEAAQKEIEQLKDL